ncbi:hypothetical protein ACNOYE_19620 [Nannocystaceae bacterium ST9]
MSKPSRTPIRPPTDALRAALERDLIEWADDVSLRLVWADLLQIDGDPLGRLVVLDHVGEARPELRPEAEALRESLAGRLDAPRQREFTLRWQLGFVHTLEVRPRGDIRNHTRAIADALRRPALRFLECLHVIVADELADPWPPAILASTSHPTLRELHVGDPPRVRERPSGTYEPGRGVRRHDYTSRSESMSRFPRLRWVSVGGELARLACRDGGSDTRMHHVAKLARQPLTSRNRTALIRAIWDTSSSVQDAAFATIGQLGPRAEFVLDDLELLLRPPLGDRDPRQAQAFQAMAAIGPASAGMLASLIGQRDLSPFVGREARCVAMLGWITKLGRAGRPALKLVETLLASKPDEIPAKVRSAAKSARKALLAE